MLRRQRHLGFSGWTLLFLGCGRCYDHEMSCFEVCAQGLLHRVCFDSTEVLLVESGASEVVGSKDGVGVATEKNHQDLHCEAAGLDECIDQAFRANRS